MNKNLTRGLAVALACVVGLSVAGCGEVAEDSQKGERNTGPADIINMPDGFSNVAHKCDGPNMVYVIYHGDTVHGAEPYGSVAVVANDPRCKTS